MFETVWKTARSVAIGYLMVAAFLVLFFLWLKKGESYAPGMSDPKWGLLIAAILVFPVLLPAIKKHVLPNLRSVKLGDFLEISLQEVEVTGYSSEQMTQQWQQNISGDFTLSQTVEMMNSYSSVIVDGIKQLQESQDAVLVVDFREGKAWIPPNLYFLSLLARYRTRVRQIVFVETREVPSMFIGSASPDELEKALGARFPIFRTAAANCRHQEGALDLTPFGVGTTFFQALRVLYSQQEGAEQVRKLWLNSTKLAELVDGTVLDRERISWKEKLTGDDYRQIVASVQPCVAVVKNGQLESLVSRDRVALLAARALRKWPWA